MQQVRNKIPVFCDTIKHMKSICLKIRPYYAYNPLAQYLRINNNVMILIYI